MSEPAGLAEDLAAACLPAFHLANTRHMPTVLTHMFKLSEPKTLVLANMHRHVERTNFHAFLLVVQRSRPVIGCICCGCLSLDTPLMISITDCVSACRRSR